MIVWQILNKCFYNIVCILKILHNDFNIIFLSQFKWVVKRQELSVNWRTLNYFFNNKTVMQIQCTRSLWVNIYSYYIYFPKEEFILPISQKNNILHLKITDFLDNSLKYYFSSSKLGFVTYKLWNKTKTNSHLIKLPSKKRHKLFCQFSTYWLQLCK